MTVLVLLLAGCGGSPSATRSVTPSTTASATTSAPAPSASSSSSSPGTPTPSPSAGDLRTTTTSSQAAVPSGGPTEAKDFPVPPGVKVKAPAPQARSWQFDITTKDTAQVLAFYRKALAAQGYRVENDVTTQVGDEKVHYDIAFHGPAEGYVVADPSQDDVFVVVQSLPVGR
ncbi:hypothetical protein D9V37_02350 [Nocardioides mangrovicus]|uniref:Uncharacterized protein n=1 Tax=Nocardioides mangrovicus TaxID=2478913 RepID=A0A3L8P8J8_9ACTN|nr:hypothetical protein D9V37_02350 [Nocardioides mangrovicus]